MKRLNSLPAKNHMKRPKGLYWWQKKEPVIVYYRAYDADGGMLIEDRSPYETIGRTATDNVAYYERIECYQVTPGWKRWKPSKDILNHPRTKEFIELMEEAEEDAAKEVIRDNRDY
jgi:hypothetical protein